MSARAQDQGGGIAGRGEQARPRRTGAGWMLACVLFGLLLAFMFSGFRPPGAPGGQRLAPLLSLVYMLAAVWAWLLQHRDRAGRLRVSVVHLLVIVFMASTWIAWNASASLRIKVYTAFGCETLARAHLRDFFPSVVAGSPGVVRNRFPAVASLHDELAAWPWGACARAAAPVAVAAGLEESTDPRVDDHWWAERERLIEELGWVDSLYVEGASGIALRELADQAPPGLRLEAVTRHAAWELAVGTDDDSWRRLALVVRLGHTPRLLAGGVPKCAICGPITGPAPDVLERADGALVWTDVEGAQHVAPSVSWMPRTWQPPAPRPAMPPPPDPEEDER